MGVGHSEGIIGLGYASNTAKQVGRKFKTGFRVICLVEKAHSSNP